MSLHCSQISKDLRAKQASRLDGFHIEKTFFRRSAAHQYPLVLGKCRAGFFDTLG
jgi:hypothetical protein